MEFEWDEDKNDVNIAKHGIDFRDAIRVFDDERCLTREDRRNDYGESRVQLLGAVQSHLLFVVYTERHGDTIRIISARLAAISSKPSFRLASGAMVKLFPN